MALIRDCVKHIIHNYKNAIIKVQNDLTKENANITIVLNFQSTVNESKKMFTTLTLQYSDTVSTNSNLLHEFFDELN